MSTIVFVHAHPDDEASQTSGSMARAAAEGHRVVTVFATNGDHGELPAEGLPEGETLVHWRRREAQASAAATGIHRLVWLGYADSGMRGWEQNQHEGALFGADLEEVAGRIAQVLDEERADVVVGYDWHGNYGHPDHVKVHQAVRRAAELTSERPRLLESTMNRDVIRAFFRQAQELAAADEAFDPDQPMDDGNPLGTPEAEIQWQVDVSDYLAQRRAALEAHRSQATDIETFLSLPPEVFRGIFSREYYLEPGLAQSMRVGWPFAGPAR